MGHSRSPRTGGLNPLFEVELNLAAKGSRESARTLYRELKAAILEGRLLAGAKLPPARTSEAYFGVSRNTAVEVYDRLVNEGYVFTRQGSGTFVAERTPAPALRREPPGKSFPGPRLNPFWLDPNVTAAIGFWRDGPERSPAARHTRHVDFRPALVDPRLFPLEIFRRVSADPAQANRCWDPGILIALNEVYEAQTIA